MTPTIIIVGAIVAWTCGTVAWWTRDIIRHDDTLHSRTAAVAAVVTLTVAAIGGVIAAVAAAIFTLAT